MRCWRALGLVSILVVIEPAPGNTNPGDLNDLRLASAPSEDPEAGPVWMDQSGMPALRQPDLRIDRFGNPIVLSRWDNGLIGTRWRAGTGWDRSTPIISDLSYFRHITSPRLAIDDNNSLWATWDQMGTILYTSVKGLQPVVFPVKLARQDGRVYVDPTVETGGGQVWITWFGGIPGDEDVFVSQVTGARRINTNLTSELNGIHWSPDVAVDESGVPHITWVETQSGTIYYSFLGSDGIWSKAAALNHPQAITADVLARPQIITTGNGVFHVVWAGVARGGTDTDIYYSRRNDRGHWEKPDVLSGIPGVGDYNPEIRGRSSDDLWVVWNTEEEGTSRIFGAHFNGKVATSPVRIDSGLSARNRNPRIDLDGSGYPWVVWEAGGAVSVYSRHMATLIAEFRRAVEPLTPSQDPASSRVLMLEVPPFVRAGQPIEMRLGSPVSGDVILAMFDVQGRRLAGESKLVQAGQQVLSWSPRSASGRVPASGIYFVRARLGYRTASGKVVLTP